MVNYCELQIYEAVYSDAYSMINFIYDCQMLKSISSNKYFSNFYMISENVLLFIWYSECVYAVIHCGMFYGKNEVKSLSVSLYFEWTAIFFRLEIKVLRIFLHFFGCSILSYQWLNGYEEKYLFSFARIMIYFPPQQSVIFEHSFYCRIFFECFYFLFMRVSLF